MVAVCSSEILIPTHYPIRSFTVKKFGVEKSLLNAHRLQETHNTTPTGYTPTKKTDTVTYKHTQTPDTSKY